jgi:ATP-dependent helicase/DNAse subunit B
VHSAPIVAGAYHDRLAPQVRACVQKVTRLDAELWNGKRPIESFAPSELDEYRETNGPAFDVSKQARGGTRAIKAQSECPFKAFATFRLRASLPEDASFGFDALDRGKFVHTALENVWKELKSSTALHAATPAQIWELVQMAVGKTLENQDGTEFYAQTSQVERDRLQQLIYDWLMTVERERTVPFTVDSAEEPMHITLGGLPLRVRMDRVDRLEDGGLVLIDYKTGGNINKNRLVGERPAEPQLLIYAAAQERNVDGVLFGCLAPRELRYAGFTRCKLTKLRTVEVEKDWDAFILESRDTVEGLAREYLHGEAVIRPSKHACEYCDLAALCRKDEQENTAEED